MTTPPTTDMLDFFAAHTCTMRDNQRIANYTINTCSNPPSLVLNNTDEYLGKERITLLQTHCGWEIITETVERQDEKGVEAILDNMAQMFSHHILPKVDCIIQQDTITLPQVNTEVTTIIRSLRALALWFFLKELDVDIVDDREEVATQLAQAVHELTHKLEAVRFESSLLEMMGLTSDQFACAIAPKIYASYRINTCEELGEELYLAYKKKKESK